MVKEAEKLRDHIFTVIDTETTGFSPGCGDRICEIALVKVKNWQIRDRYETLINPGREIPPQVTRVNSITNSMVYNCPLFSEIAFKVKNFIKDSILVFHNADFDMRFIKNEFKVSGVEFINNRVVDTLRLSRKSNFFKSNSLSYISRKLSISHNQKHRAMSDAVATLEIFKYIVARLNLSSLDDIIKYQNI